MSFTRRGLVRHVVVLAVAGSASAAFAGPDWVEVGDAGSAVATAQYPLRPFGAPALVSISGSLSSGVGSSDYEDLYVFRITDPATFSITPAFANFNAVLYLFNITLAGEAFGLLANDNASKSDLLPRLESVSTDGTMMQVSRPGDYILAVAGAGRVPISRSGEIFNMEGFTEISGPDGPGGINPLSGWTGEGEQGQYRFIITAGDFPSIPAPGAAAMLVIGSLAMTRRRR